MIGEARMKMGEVGERLRERRVEGRIDDLDRENVRLRTEVSQLRNDLDHERSLLRQALQGLRGRPTVVRKRRGGIVRTALVGGGAYVLGTRAGRERYEQLVEWLGKARTKAMRGDDGLTSAMEASTASDEGDAITGRGSASKPTGSMTEADRVAP